MTIRLAAFDLDGTLVRGETICEVFARRLGRLDRMRELEQLRDRDDVALAREEMAGWYREAARDELLELLPALPLAPGVSEGFALLRERGIEIAITSITWEFSVAWFAESLGVRHGHGTGLAADWSIDHVWPEDKPVLISALARSLGIAPSEIAAVGDTWGDTPLLLSAGRGYYVGAPPIPLVPGALHFPDGDIGAICRHIAVVR